MEHQREPGGMRRRDGADRYYAIGIKVAEQQLEDTDVATVVTEIAALVQEFWRVGPGVRERVVGIGVTVGGHVDGRSGTVLHSPNLDWNDVVPLAHLLKQATGFEAV